MLKKTIRKEFDQRRKLLSEQQQLDWSVQMMEHFLSLRLPSLHHILGYYPIMDRNEFDVLPVLEWLNSHYPDLVISWPKMDEGSNVFEAYQLNPEYGFLKNEYLIPEPFKGIWTPPESIDLVLVPLLAVNKQGFRVGYGKGYYDRYLTLCRPNVLKVGFSYFEPIEEISDIHHFDVPLSYCITPTRIYEF